MNYNRYLSILTVVLFTVLSFIAKAEKIISIPDDVFINNLYRKFVVSSPVIREQIALSIKSKADNVESFYLSIPTDLVDDISTMVMFIKAEKDQILPIEEDEVDTKMGIQYFKVKLDKPLNKDERIIVNYEATILRKLQPYPKYIEQNDEQYVKFETNVYFYTPYEVTKQKTMFETESTINTYSPEPSPVKKDGSDVLYGSYENIKPFSKQLVTLHYRLKENMIHFEKLDRTIEISHWGSNVAVKEDMVVRHDGSILKDNFNRIQFRKSQFYSDTPSSLKDMIFILPPNAHDIFFVDVIGNVSTSSFHKDDIRTLLQVLPRYPLFGGWKYTWSQGYNNPLGDNLKYNKKIGKYVFQAPVLLSLKNTHTDHFKLTIKLPEGVRNVDVSLPYNFDKEERKMTYSYLDTTGKPTIILEKDNVCDDHFQYFQITYNLPFYFVFQKPLVVALFIFTLFLMSMIYTRLDLSIVKDPNSDKHDLAVLYWESISSTISNGMKVLEKLNNTNEIFIQNSNEEQYKDSRQKINVNINDTIRLMKETQKQLDEIDQVELSTKVKDLIRLFKEKEKVIDLMYETKTNHVKIEPNIKSSIEGESVEEEGEGKEKADNPVETKYNQRMTELNTLSNEIDKNIKLIINTQIL